MDRSFEQQDRGAPNVIGKIISRFKKPSHVSPNNLLVNSYIYGFDDVIKTKDGQVYPLNSLLGNADLNIDEEDKTNQ